MRIHFVLNPQAGRVRSRNLVAAIRREFAGHEIAISSAPPNLPQPKPFRSEDLLWPAAEPEAPDLVVAVGGDGTVNRVINAVADRDIPVGIIPCGSSNDLAGQLGIPSDPRRACRVIRSARLTDIDLISVNGRYFATCGGFGLAGDVALRANVWRHEHGPAGDTTRRTNVWRHEHGPAGDTTRRTSAWRRGNRWRFRLARRLGRRIYPLALLGTLFGRWRPPIARVLCGEEDRAEAWFSLLVSNQPRFGGFSASPQADQRDGRMDICRMLAPAGRGRMLWIALMTYLGRADRCPEVSQRRVGEATILAQEPVSFFGDGEILERGRFFRVRVHPRALWVAAPQGARTWSWWRNCRDQQDQLIRYYLRRPSCRPMTTSVPAADTVSNDFSGCPPSR